MAYTLVPTELIVDGAITSAKLDTNIAISGTLGVTGEVTLATHLNMGDNDKIKIGTGGDLEIYHDGSNSYISNSTGNIYLGDTNGAVHIQAKLNEESIICAADGAVSLYHDNAVKLATTSTGIDVTGVITTDGLTTSADINFGDNDKAVFGAGDDLQIYHNANTSFITESGSSNFKIGGENLYLQNTAHNENYLAAIANQGVTLYYNNAPKIATTSTGIDVTGTATMDGLTVDGGADASTSYARFTEYSSGYGFNGAYASYNGSSNELIFGRHNTFDSYIANDIPVMSFARSTGDISFYEDTGTTAKFFWDASAESLGIGTTSPSTKLHVHEAGASEPLGLFQTTTTGDCAVRIEGIGGESYLEIANTSATTGNTSNSWGIGSNDDTNLHIAYGTNGTMNKNSDNAQFFINSSTGNVEIGTDSPNAKLTINNSIATTYSTTGYAATPAYSMLYLHNTNGGSNTASLINFRTGSGDGVIGFVEGGGTNDADFVIQTDGGSNGVERLRILNSGNVGIGDPSPSAKLEVAGSSNSTYLIAGGDDSSNGRALTFTSSAGANFNGAIHTIRAPSSQGEIAFKTYNTEVMRIDSSANVGIGANNPLSKLHVFSATATSTPKDTYAVALFDDDEGRIQVRATNSGSDGAVVGLSTGSHNWGLMATAAGTFSNAFAIGYVDTSTDGNVFGVGSMSEKLIITTSGNVGINTTPRTSTNKHNLSIDGTWGGQLDIGVSGTSHARFGSDNFASGKSCRIESNDAIIFKRNGNERMRVHDDGALIANFGVTLGTTTGTYTAAKTLDDYEEGTWTPSWTNGIGNGTSNGTYVKVGQIVHVTAFFQMGTTTSIGNKLEATNLPFNCNQITYSGARYENYQQNSYIGMTRAGGNVLRGYVINVAGTQATELIASTSNPFTWGNQDYAQLSITYTI